MARRAGASSVNTRRSPALLRAWALVSASLKAASASGRPRVARARARVSKSSGLPGERGLPYAEEQSRPGPADHRRLARPGARERPLVEGIRLAQEAAALELAGE